MENANPNGLTWDGVESACGFWAVYPASMVGTGTTNTVNLSIASTQTATDGLTSAPMVAAVNNATPGDPVTLEFYPAFTAFEITLKSKDQNITLNTFALTSASKALSGTFPQLSPPAEPPHLPVPTGQMRPGKSRTPLIPVRSLRMLKMGE